MKNFDQTKFVNDLLEVVQNTDDIDVVLNKWASIFSLILEKLIRERRDSEKFCSWSTNDFKVMCKAREKLKKQATCSKSAVLMQSYGHIGNKVNKINGELKRDYFTHKFLLLKVTQNEHDKLLYQ